MLVFIYFLQFHFVWPVVEVARNINLPTLIFKIIDKFGQTADQQWLPELFVLDFKNCRIITYEILN